MYAHACVGLRFDDEGPPRVLRDVNGKRILRGDGKPFTWQPKAARPRGLLIHVNGETVSWLTLAHEFAHVLQSGLGLGGVPAHNREHRRLTDAILADGLPVE